MYVLTLVIMVLAVGMFSGFMGVKLQGKFNLAGGWSYVFAILFSVILSQVGYYLVDSLYK